MTLPFGKLIDKLEAILGDPAKAQSGRKSGDKSIAANPKCEEVGRRNKGKSPNALIDP